MSYKWNFYGAFKVRKNCKKYELYIIRAYNIRPVSVRDINVIILQDLMGFVSTNRNLWGMLSSGMLSRVDIV
jgi:hypothetical protein